MIVLVPQSGETERKTLWFGLFVQVHDQTLLHINNHLENGAGNDLDGAAVAGGHQPNALKEQILTELERRVTLSCSACQVKPDLLYT